MTEPNTSFDDESRISQAEMIALFGDEMPMEAVALLWNADDGKTVGQIRSELREIAARHSEPNTSFVLVPSDPTDEMIAAVGVGVTSSFGALWPSICRDIYRKLIAARPSPSVDAGEVERLRLLLTDLVRASAVVEADWDEFGCITNGEGYAHWNACIDAASGYLAKDAPDPINETNR